MGGKHFQFDVAVIGGGAAGLSAAESANRLGVDVVLIETAKLGGECPNDACVPTKTLLKSARTFYHAKHQLAEYGVYASNVTFRFSEIIARRHEVVAKLTGKGRRLHTLMDKLGIDVIQEYAKFLDPHTIQIGKDTLTAKAFVLATGSSSFIPPIAGLEECGFITYLEASTLPTLPKSLVIIGGGPVGCEYATFFAMLGVQVTILERNARILEREDESISNEAEKVLQSYGVKIYTNATTLSVKKERRQKAIAFQVEGKRRSVILAEQILVASGKFPNIAGLNPLSAGLALDAKRRLKINESLQTNVKHLFAAGDIALRMQFTHVAQKSGAIAGENAARLALKKRKMLIFDQTVIPRVTFIEPEIASVGITENEAKSQKLACVTGEFPIQGLGRALTDGNRMGFLKLVVNEKTRHILGAHMIGQNAGEVIHEIALAMHVEATVDDLAATMHAFPTYSELIPAAASQI